MDQVLKVITLYDITAYLLPGIVVVWAILRARQFIQGSWPHPWSWKLIVVAYFVGQLLQVIMSDQRHWLSWQDPIHLQKLEQVFPDEADNVREKFRNDLILAIRNAFHDPPPKEWFHLCESYNENRRLESFVEVLRARFGFFRGLFLSLAIAAVALMIAALVRLRSRTARPSRREWMENVLLILACVAGAWLSHERTNDFDRYYAEETYRAFYVDFVLGEKRDATAR